VERTFPPGAVRSGFSVRSEAVPQELNEDVRPDVSGLSKNSD
jgi:hypothetical protein